MNYQPVIGDLRPSRASEIAAILAGVDAPLYEEFDTDTMQGLAKVANGEIEILAVLSKREKCGNFRSFIADLKQNYTSISIWEIWNPNLRVILKRYGFRDAHRREKDGERITGMKWSTPLSGETTMRQEGE